MLTALFSISQVGAQVKQPKDTVPKPDTLHKLMPMPKLTTPQKPPVNIDTVYRAPQPGKVPAKKPDTSGEVPPKRK